MAPEDLLNVCSTLTPHVEPDDHAAETDFHTVEVGQWYWVNPGDAKKRWLGCVMAVGSNYVELRSRSHAHGYSTCRIHHDDFWKHLAHAPDAEAHITAQVQFHQAESERLMGEVKAITARLGVSKQSALPGSAQGNSGHALVTLSSQPDIKGYENALVLARDKQLPELFESIKQSNQNMAGWLEARSLPMLALAENMKGCIGEIQNRVFNVSLYAGLTEEVVQCCAGEPAAFHEKLRVMQRLLYMDEECLLNYRHGGMEFKHIEKFDTWISEPENRDRILPFPRCLVAMRVRRMIKDRHFDGSLRQALIIFDLEISDKFTFLYLRNGNQVWRLSTDLEFGELIFPDKAVFDPSEPMMAKMFGGRVDKLISRREYDLMKREREDAEALRARWEIEHPKESWDEEAHGPYWMSNPYRNARALDFHPRNYEPFDPTSVFFDDMTKLVGDEIKQYNRIALIIQGLFDRSEVFHPHPPVKTWTQDGFNAAVELIYDGTAALSNGKTPDFDAYRARCNASLDVDSVVIGQEHYWLDKIAEKESNDSQYRGKPYGNDGPGWLAKMAKWKPRSRMAVFAWNRMRMTDAPGYCNKGKRYGDPIRTTLTVPAHALFNISAYKPGDYKQFFQDHRTRAQYLKWAPMLIAAEEYWAGNATVQEPVDE